MSMRRLSSCPRYLVGLGMLASFVFSLSYYTLMRMTTPSDRLLYGRKISDLAEEIRKKLLDKQHGEMVNIIAGDNIHLSGILLKRHQAHANIICCHGYQSRKEFMYGFADIFPRSNILLFDFRAHGDSEGSITSIGYHEAKDVSAATKYLQMESRKKNDGEIPTIILGISMGGAAALKAVEKDPTLCDVLIVDSTYSSLRHIIHHALSKNTLLPEFPFYSVMINLFHFFAQCNVDDMNTYESVKRIKQPLMLIHGCNDSFITPKNSLELYANSRSVILKLWIGPKCEHGWLSTYYPELYQKKITKFLKRALPKIDNL